VVADCWEVVGSLSVNVKGSAARAMVSYGGEEERPGAGSDGGFASAECVAGVRAGNCRLTVLDQALNRLPVTDPSHNYDTKYHLYHARDAFSALSALSARLSTACFRSPRPS